MIVSHRHRFIFFAVPRTGTHAIREALTPFLGPEDWQQEALRQRVFSPLPALARIGHGHVRLRDAQMHLPEEVWRGYFKFAVVRHPFDRFVSACAMLNARNPRYGGAETAFMKKALGVAQFRGRVLIRPQSELLVDDAGRLGMDFVGRYEDLAGAWREICQRIGIAEAPLVRRNATEHAPFARLCDAALRAELAHFYRSDFQLFGYSPCV